jgi:flagellar basal body-associated protein FliL
VGIPANYRKHLFIEKEDVKDTPRKYSSELLWIVLLVLIFLAVIATITIYLR